MKYALTHIVHAYYIQYMYSHVCIHVSAILLPVLTAVESDQSACVTALMCVISVITGEQVAF